MRLARQKLLQLVIFFLICFSTSTVYAQTAPGAVEQLLELIRQNTYETLKRVNELPDYLRQFGEFMFNWSQADDSDNTANLQANFTQLGNVILYATDPKAIQTQTVLNQDLLGIDPKNPGNFLNANDLTYSTLIGNRFLNPDPRPVNPKTPIVPEYNYIKNASGINIPHERPQPAWQGRRVAQIKYQSLYNTIMAAESFGGNTLISQYLEGNQYLKFQRDLVKKAVDPNFFVEVASQDLGVVFRQLLLFQSQIYVLLTQLVQTQKQLLTAQVINNTLIIASLIPAETGLLANAQGITPQPGT